MISCLIWASIIYFYSSHKYEKKQNLIIIDSWSELNNKTLFLYVSGDVANRWKRQATTEASDKKEESFEQELCKDKEAGEWFRLVTGEKENCRDVIQCTSSVGFSSP